MAEFGSIILLLTLVVAVYTAAASIVGYHTGSRRLQVSGQYGTFAVFGLLSVASFALIYLFVTDDYSVKYVQHYSDRSMPLFYKATAFWGGQDGSLLFWVWVMSIWGAVAVYQNREKNKDLMPYTIVAFMAVAIFFVSLMMYGESDPFSKFLAGAPTDGQGLNPLLQNPYMVIHPPMLYLGYIGWTIPFCFAIGALAHGKLDYGWIAAMRRWCLVAWVFLTVGLTLGGLWAYEELGWGGYWAWDPVENAAFIPWLTGTAFIHSVQVQERRQMYKVWNLLLIILTFLLTLLGTMMTRSGIVQSVHAFAQSDIGGWFFVFIGISAVAGFGLLIYRWNELRPENGLESVLSREFAFLINNWVLLAATFFVTFATMFPSIYKYIAGKEINVSPPFFNKWMVPIGLIMLFMTGVGPLLSWRKSTVTTIRQQFALPGLLGLLSAPAFIFGANIVEPYPVITLVLCVFVTATIFQEFARGTWYRMKNAQENVLDAFVTLVAKARRRYGGYTVHFGAVLMFFGFVGNCYQLEQDLTFTQGMTRSIGQYDVRFDGLRFEDDGQKTMVTAETSVFERGTDRQVGTLSPAKWIYRKPPDQPSSEIKKLMSWQEDLYLVLGGYDGEANTAVIQLKVNPLVNFVWLGCAFMMVGFWVAVSPERRRARAKIPFRRRVSAFAGAASLVLAVVATVLAFV